MARVTKLILVLALLLPAMGWATTDTEAGPGVVVHDTSEEMLKVLRANRQMLKKQPDKIVDLVDKIVVPHFDFVRISAWVLGKHWREATPVQRGLFVQQFQSLMVNTYATALLEYSDYKITYTPVRMEAGDRVVMVRTNVDRVGADPIDLDYRMFHGNDGWKVFDILVDNVSLVANYRTSFDQEIRETSIDALIKRLTEHNEKNKAGKA